MFKFWDIQGDINLTVYFLMGSTQILFTENINLLHIHFYYHLPFEMKNHL